MNSRQTDEFQSYIYKVAVLLIGLLAFACLVLGGSYYLAVHAVDVNNSTQHALQVREQQSQLRASIPTCKALQELAKDSDAILALPGAQNPTPSAMPLVTFFKDIKDVYSSSNCVQVLEFAQNHH